MSIIEQYRAYNNSDKPGSVSLRAMLSEKAWKNKVPLSAHYELTPLCTLNCKMCYSHIQKLSAEEENQILSGNQWIALIRESVRMGTLYATLSGGECILHPDFNMIYSEMYDMGMQITVMTNATTITDDKVRMFCDRPPASVSITMYGFSEETYLKTCRVEGMFQKVLNGIKSLKTAGIPIDIKCTVTRDMFDDFDDIFRFAKENGFLFQYDNIITSFRECTNDLSSLFVSTDELYDKVMRLKNIKDNPENGEVIIPDDTKVIEKGIQCGAANNSYHIDWRGHMHPCISLPVYTGRPLEEGFEKSWYDMIEWAKNVPQIKECQVCPHQNKCRICIANHYLDTGCFGKVSSKHCWADIHQTERPHFND